MITNSTLKKDNSYETLKLGNERYELNFDTKEHTFYATYPYNGIESSYCGGVIVVKRKVIVKDCKTHQELVDKVNKAYIEYCTLKTIDYSCKLCKSSYKDVEVNVIGDKIVELGEKILKHHKNENPLCKMGLKDIKGE